MSDEYERWSQVFFSSEIITEICDVGSSSCLIVFMIGGATTCLVTISESKLMTWSTWTYATWQCRRRYLAVRHASELSPNMDMCLDVDDVLFEHEADQSNEPLQALSQRWSVMLSVCDILLSSSRLHALETGQEGTCLNLS